MIKPKNRACVNTPRDVIAAGNRRANTVTPGLLTRREITKASLLYRECKLPYLSAAIPYVFIISPT